MSITWSGPRRWPMYSSHWNSAEEVILNPTGIGHLCRGTTGCAAGSSWLVNTCWLITRRFLRAFTTLPLQLLQTLIETVAPLDFRFRNIFCDTQRLTSILKADIQAAIQLRLNEIKAQLFSLMVEFQQKLLDEASALDLTQLQMFTHGLCDCDRDASALSHCQAKQQDELAKDSFFKGGPTLASMML